MYSCSVTDLHIDVVIADVVRFSGMKVSKASRRIKPTLVSPSSAHDTKCFSTFNSVPIVPAPANAMPRSVWAKPRSVQYRYLSTVACASFIDVISSLTKASICSVGTTVFRRILSQATKFVVLLRK